MLRNSNEQKTIWMNITDRDFLWPTLSPRTVKEKTRLLFWWGSYETNSIDFHCQWDKDISKLMRVLAGGWHLFFSFGRWVWTVASGDHHDALWENKWSFCRGESEVFGNKNLHGIVSGFDALVWGFLYVFVQTTKSLDQEARAISLLSKRFYSVWSMLD